VLYQTAQTSAIPTANHFALALAAFGLLAVWSIPPWLVVLLTAARGGALARLGRAISENNAPVAAHSAAMACARAVACDGKGVTLSARYSQREPLSKSIAVSNQAG
jgi:hypothetical protein